jgi:hypothetical protein
MEPGSALQSIARLVGPGGHVVVYTINRWSPLSIIPWLFPFWLHQPIKRVVWRTEEKDTFPVAYKVNTRKQLGQLFTQAGFRETAFAYLDDCRATCRFQILNFLELNFRTFLHWLGMRYPENCLLGVYEKL